VSTLTRAFSTGPKAVDRAVSAALDSWEESFSKQLRSALLAVAVEAGASLTRSRKALRGAEGKLGIPFKGGTAEYRREYARRKRAGTLGDVGGEAAKPEPTAKQREAVGIWENNFDNVRRFRQMDAGGKAGDSYISSLHPHLTSALNEAPRFDGPTYRGMVDVDLDQFKVGASVDIKAMTATSKDLDVARDFAGTKYTNADRPVGKGRGALLEFLGGSKSKADLVGLASRKKLKEVVIQKSKWKVERISKDSKSGFTKVTLRAK
jgi:hypothetical protein